MTALWAVLKKIWPFILTAGAFLFAWAKGKDADSKVSKANAAEAGAENEVAQYKQANAEANEKAAEATTTAVKERADVEADVAAGDSASVLRDHWSN